jgi:hypothetical protein
MSSRAARTARLAALFFFPTSARAEPPDVAPQGHAVTSEPGSVWERKLAARLHLGILRSQAASRFTTRFAVGLSTMVNPQRACAPGNACEGADGGAPDATHLVYADLAFGFGFL